ncbi:unnamed protein product [Victoria cruziana]
MTRSAWPKADPATFSFLQTREAPAARRIILPGGEHRMACSALGHTSRGNKNGHETKIEDGIIAWSQGWRKILPPGDRPMESMCHASCLDSAQVSSDNSTKN